MPEFNEVSKLKNKDAVLLSHHDLSRMKDVDLNCKCLLKFTFWFRQCCVLQSLSHKTESAYETHACQAWSVWPNQSHQIWCSDNQQTTWQLSIELCLDSAAKTCLTWWWGIFLIGCCCENSRPHLKLLTLLNPSSSLWLHSRLQGFKRVKAATMSVRTLMKCCKR